MTTTAETAGAAALTGSALARWLDAYGAAWEDRDGAAGARLFAEHAEYHWGPFDVLHGRARIAERWTTATGDQREVRFRHTPLAIAGDRAFVHWRCTFARRSTGLHHELDGIFALRFDAHGQCCELREWWLAREERAT